MRALWKAYPATFASAHTPEKRSQKISRTPHGAVSARTDAEGDERKERDQGGVFLIHTPTSLTPSTFPPPLFSKHPVVCMIHKPRLATQVMDAALLLVAGNETCPQPQTSEHLAAVEIMRLQNIIILQNKVR